MNCPNCRKQNPAGSRFCQFCGTEMPAAAVTAAPAKSPAAAATGSQQSPATVRPQGVAPATRTGQLGQGGMNAASVWGPFAGYGTRGRHASWLLDDLGHRAEDLHKAVTRRFDQRRIPSSNMHWKTLIAKGLLVEKRPFYFVRRGISTVALYIAQFGKDLYISQVTYVKGPISPVRVLIVSMMILFALYFTFLYTSALGNRLGEFVGGFDIFGSSGVSFPAFLLCVVGPMGILNQLLLGLLFLYSVYKWLRERDFLAVVRARPNEFQHDDTIALEKAVEETVRQSLDEIGIDAKLMPEAKEYGFRDRLI